MALTVYLVGGAVRDELLGRDVQDRDWVVIGATPQLLLAQGYQQIGNDFPCFLHPQTKEEYALARTERKSGRGYGGFVCDFSPEITLEEDLSRRDLTINAIAKNTDGEYIDPYGGMADLRSGILRHVSAAFAEDPLRVLRVARFAARFADLGFSVHPETLTLMQSLVDAGEMAELTPERVWKEMSRALAEPRPSEFFIVLRACGALEQLLPEVDRLFCESANAENKSDGVYTMAAMNTAQALYSSPVITWAVAMLYLGIKEPCTDAAGEHQLRATVVNDICQRFRVPSEYRELSVLVCQYYLRCDQVLTMSAEALFELINDVDGIRRPERLVLFAQACRAHACAHMSSAECEYLQSHWLMVCAQAIKSIDTQPLLAQGYRGLALAEQIRIERIKRIEVALVSLRSNM